MSTTKRGQGEGSWRQRPSGSWEYRFRVVDPGTGFTRRHSVVARTKAEARAAADEVKRNAKAGVSTVSRSSSRTLGDWLDYWIAEVLPHSGRGAATRAQYAGLLRVHVREHPVARVKLVDLRPSQLAAAVGGARKASGEPLALSSKRSLHAALVAALDTAVDDRAVGENVMRRAARPRNAKLGRSAEVKALSDDQLEQLLASTAGHRHDALVRVAILTGMRRGELLGLEWAGVDFEQGRVRVRQQITSIDDGEELSDVKTDAGDRWIAMGEELRDVLLEHGAAEQERLDRLATPNTELVFTDRHGHALSPRAVSRWYADRAAAAGLEQTGLHALRHTAISRWLMSEVPITVVAKWAGHASPEVTLRIYSWALPVDESDFANRVRLPMLSPAASPTS